MQPRFKVDSEPGKILRDWWAGLEDKKGDRAALRRCNTLTEVVFVPTFHDLCSGLKRGGECSARPERLPAIAGLLAHVRPEGDPKQDLGDGLDLPKQMASPKKSGIDPALSELRFRRLLQCRTAEELFPNLRRVVNLLGNRVDIYSLAESTYFWNDRIRKKWAYAYYDALHNKQ